MTRNTMLAKDMAKGWSVTIYDQRLLQAWDGHGRTRAQAFNRACLRRVVALGEAIPREVNDLWRDLLAGWRPCASRASTSSSLGYCVELRRGKA